MFLRNTSLKTVCTVVLAAVSLSVSAKFETDGYYRVQNYKSGRYIYVLDNKGELNMQATTADLGALELWLGYEKTVSDPASVIYMTNTDGKLQDFDFQAQGTGVIAMISRAVTMYYESSTGTYRIYGRDSGVSRYIGDGTESDGNKGRVSSTQPASSEWVKWYVHPITGSDDQYFGITPDVSSGSDYYATFYAAFPFSPEATGMTVYYVSRIVDNVAIISEIQGVVPASTPVIIKCGSSEAIQNKITLGGSATAVSGNKLSGVYFKNESISHNNVTDYNPNTMRLFGTDASGNPAFVTATDTYLPRNKAYLPVPEGSPSELRIMTEQDYNASVEGIYVDREIVAERYTDLSGRAITNPTQGLYLKTETYSDGSIHTVKVLVK